VKADVFSIGFVASCSDHRQARDALEVSVLPLGWLCALCRRHERSEPARCRLAVLPAEQRAQTFPSKPVWQRAIIVAAGPVMNFIIAILILAGFRARSWCQRNPGDHRVDSTWQRAAQGWPCAERSHRRTGRPSIENFADMADFTLMRSGEKIIIDYLHGNTPVQRRDAHRHGRRARSFWRRGPESAGSALGRGHRIAPNQQSSKHRFRR